MAHFVILEFQERERKQDQSIMVACQENDDKLLEQHLNRPRNPNVQNAGHTGTPLCAASLRGSLKCVSLLVEAGANKDQGRTDDGATPLFMAAHQGHLEVVRFLVESGANKDQGTTDDGATPLHIAAAKRRLEVVRFLVESGANKDQGATDDGATPLHIAAAKGRLEVVRFLVESGANKDQGARDDGVTPLFIAANGGHVEVVRCVVRSDANKDQGTRRHGLTRLVCDQRDVLDGVGECRRVLKRLRCSSCRAGWARDLEPQCRRRFDKFGIKAVFGCSKWRSSRR